MKGPDLLPKKSRFYLKVLFSPITPYLSTKSRWQNFVTQALRKATSKPFLLQMDLQKGKGRPGLPSLKLGAAPAQGQVLFSSQFTPMVL